MQSEVSLIAGSGYVQVRGGPAAEAGAHDRTSAATTDRERQSTGAGQPSQS